MLTLLQKTGSSPDMATGAGGIPGAITPPPSLYVLAKITGIQNNGATTDLPCYSYTVVLEQDVFQGITQKILYQRKVSSPGFLQGDFRAIDPSLDASTSQDRPWLPPAFEISGNVNVPVDGSAIVQLWQAEGGRHYWFKWDSDAFPGLIEATLIDKTQENGEWIYAWFQDFPVVNESITLGSGDLGLKGDLPYGISTVHTQTENGVLPDIYVTTLRASSGSFTLTEDGGTPTSNIAFNATDSTIDGALSHFTVASTFVDGPFTITRTLVFTSTDPTTSHRISMQNSVSSSLAPPTPNGPAIFLNNIEMDVPVNVFLTKGAGDVPKLATEVTQEGDGNALPTIIELDVKNVRSGSFFLILDANILGGTLSSAIPWNVSAPSLQTTLSTTIACTVTGTPATSTSDGKFIVTITADNNSHTLTGDIGSLIGTIFYLVMWSNGPSNAPVFPVTLDIRNMDVSTGVYNYGWIGIDDLTRTGSIPAFPTLTHIQTHDGLNPDKYSLVLNATGGTFVLVDSGTASSAIAYGASASTVQSALTHFTVTGTGTVGDPYILTGAAGTDTGTGTGNTLTIDPSTALTPTVGHSPATFLNNVPMDLPVNVWLKLQSGGDPVYSMKVIQQGDGVSNPTKFSLSIGSSSDGSYLVSFDGGSFSSPIAWNASSSTVQSALTSLLACMVSGSGGSFTVTVTADNNLHSATIDGSGLFGNQKYRVVWSNGNACTGAVGGVYPASISGWTGPPTATVSLTPSGSSAGPWVVTLANATGGTYQITVDGGSPVSTSSSGSPSISGFVTTGTSGSYTLTATSGSHTLLAFGGLLTASQPRQSVWINGSQCVELITPIQCPPTG